MRKAIIAAAVPPTIGMIRCLFGNGADATTAGPPAGLAAMAAPRR